MYGHIADTTRRQADSLWLRWTSRQEGCRTARQEPSRPAALDRALNLRIGVYVDICVDMVQFGLTEEGLTR